MPSKAAKLTFFFASCSTINVSVIETPSRAIPV